MKLAPSLAAVLFVLWAGFGFLTLATAPTDSPFVRVAAIQHGFTAPGHQDPDTQLERLAVLSEQTRLAAEQGARFIVWPELSFGFDPQVEHTAELQALAKETNAYILIGLKLFNAGNYEDAWRALTLVGTVTAPPTTTPPTSCRSSARR